MALSRPIIANIKGESADIINQSKSGLVDETEDQSNLADLINQMINMDEKRFNSLGIQANKFYNKNYHSRIRKSQLVDLLL